MKKNIGPEIIPDLREPGLSNEAPESRVIPSEAIKVQFNDLYQRLIRCNLKAEAKLHEHIDRPEKLQEWLERKNAIDKEIKSLLDRYGKFFDSSKNTSVITEASEKYGEEAKQDAPAELDQIQELEADETEEDDRELDHFFQSLSAENEEKKEVIPLDSYLSGLDSKINKTFEEPSKFNKNELAAEIPSTIENAHHAMVIHSEFTGILHEIKGDLELISIKAQATRLPDQEKAARAYLGRVSELEHDLSAIQSMINNGTIHHANNEGEAFAKLKASMIELNDQVEVFVESVSNQNNQRSNLNVNDKTIQDILDRFVAEENNDASPVTDNRDEVVVDYKSTNSTVSSQEDEEFEKAMRKIRGEEPVDESLVEGKVQFSEENNGQIEEVNDLESEDSDEGLELLSQSIAADIREDERKKSESSERVIQQFSNLSKDLDHALDKVAHWQALQKSRPFKAPNRINHYKMEVERIASQMVEGRKLLSEEYQRVIPEANNQARQAIIERTEIMLSMMTEIDQSNHENKGSRIAVLQEVFDDYVKAGLGPTLADAIYSSGIQEFEQEEMSEEQRLQEAQAVGASESEFAVQDTKEKGEGIKVEADVKPEAPIEPQGDSRQEISAQMAVLTDQIASLNAPLIERGMIEEGDEEAATIEQKITPLQSELQSLHEQLGILNAAEDDSHEENAYIAAQGHDEILLVREQPNVDSPQQVNSNVVAEKQERVTRLEDDSKSEDIRWDPTKDKNLEFTSKIASAQNEIALAKKELDLISNLANSKVQNLRGVKLDAKASEALAKQAAVQLNRISKAEYEIRQLEMPAGKEKVVTPVNNAASEIAADQKPNPAYGVEFVEQGQQVLRESKLAEVQQQRVEVKEPANTQAQAQDVVIQSKAGPVAAPDQKPIVNPSSQAVSAAAPKNPSAPRSRVQLPEGLVKTNGLVNLTKSKVVVNGDAPKPNAQRASSPKPNCQSLSANAPNVIAKPQPLRKDTEVPNGATSIVRDAGAQRSRVAEIADKFGGSVKSANNSVIEEKPTFKSGGSGS